MDHGSGKTKLKGDERVLQSLVGATHDYWAWGRGKQRHGETGQHIKHYQNVAPLL